MKTKTIISVISAVVLLSVMPLVAHASAGIPWSSEYYFVEADAYSGTYQSASATSYLDLPISVTAADGTGCDEAITSLSATTMSTRAYFNYSPPTYPCDNAYSGASFTGTFSSAMPFFLFDYSLDNTVGMTSLYVKDNGTEIYNEFLLSGSHTVAIPITAGNTIEVGFGQGSYMSDSTLNYSMAVVPEPVSLTLFIVGGATLGFRRFWRKRRTV
jgi:hypothetical protein